MKLVMNSLYCCLMVYSTVTVSYLLTQNNENGLATVKPSVLASNAMPFVFHSTITLSLLYCNCSYMATYWKVRCFQIHSHPTFGHYKLHEPHTFYNFLYACVCTFLDCRILVCINLIST